AIRTASSPGPIAASTPRPEWAASPRTSSGPSSDQWPMAPASPPSASEWDDRLRSAASVSWLTLAAGRAHPRFRLSTFWKREAAMIPDTLRPFLVARDLLLRLRTDYEAAVREFRWPVMDRFNWALDYFDHLPADDLALWCVGSADAKLTFGEL